MTSIIETERLILREIDPDADFKAWQEVCADADTMRYIGGEVLSPQMAWRNMALFIGHKYIRGYTMFSVIEKASGAWVGRIGPWYPHGWSAPEIGWTVHPAHTRKGIAKEAAAACVDYVFNDLGWKSVIHQIAEGNIGSIKTAEAIGSHFMRSIDRVPGLIETKCHIYGQKNPNR